MVATMPRKDAPKRNDLSVKVDAHVIRLARLLSAHEDKTMAEVLSEAARGVLMKKLDKLGVPYPPPPEPPNDEQI